MRNFGSDDFLIDFKPIIDPIEVENDRGMKKRLRIVGYEELIGNKDYISMDSPMAQALLDKKVGEEAIVKTPVAEFVWRINKIEYQKK